MRSKGLVNSLKGEYRRYGEKPLRLVLLHGGPGAAGEMQPVAQELEGIIGVLEPYQTQLTIEGQIAELRDHIEANCDTPVILCGYSWGAMLGILFSARYYELIDKLILISSGPLDISYVSQLRKSRNDRMTDTDRVMLGNFLVNENVESVDLKQISKLITRIDGYDLLSPGEEDADVTKFNHEIYTKVWSQAAKLRKEGGFLQALDRIPDTLPLHVIHGNDDPHPSSGVVDPILERGKNCTVLVIPKCGHTPWKEKYAKKSFYDEMRRILSA